MDFFDTLGSKLSQTGQKAKQTASDLRDSAKLTGQVSALTKEIQGLYAQLGEAYFKARGEEPDAAVQEHCDALKGKLKELELVRADLQRLKNVKVCPQCGAENEADARFCAQCSTPLPELPKREEPRESFCPNCGAKLIAGAKFCTKCGAKQ